MPRCPSATIAPSFIVLTVACGVGALVTAPIVLLTAAMAFDAPGSEYQVWAFPLWFVIGAIGGWVLYLHGWLRTLSLARRSPVRQSGEPFRSA
jgi:hypothetical protein